MFGYSLIKTEDYNALGHTSDKVINTCISATDTLTPISYIIGDVECEVGLVVGCNNPNFEEIKELAKRGVDKNERTEECDYNN